MVGNIKTANDMLHPQISTFVLTHTVYIYCTKGEELVLLIVTKICILVMAPSVPEKFGGFSSTLHQKSIKFQEAIFINDINYPAILLLILFQSNKKTWF